LADTAPAGRVQQIEGQLLGLGRDVEPDRNRDQAEADGGRTDRSCRHPCLPGSKETLPPPGMSNRRPGLDHSPSAVLRAAGMAESAGLMHPTLAAEPPEGTGWIFEIKWDGEGGTVRLRHPVSMGLA